MVGYSKDIMVYSKNRFWDAAKNWLVNLQLGVSCEREKTYLDREKKKILILRKWQKKISLLVDLCTFICFLLTEFWHE